MPEQRRVVARIEGLADRIEEARGLRLLAIDEAQALVGSHLNSLFGDPYANEIGDLGIDCFARLNDVAEDVADGPHTTPTYVDRGIPFVTVRNITSGRVDFSDLKYITLMDHQQYQRRARVEPGDVLLSKDGTIGIPCFVDTDEQFSFFVSVALIKPVRGKLDGRFLTWALRAPYLQDRMRARSRGDMIRHLVLREIRDLTVPIPSLPEQRNIAADLDDLQAKADTLRRLQDESDAELDALLPSILDRAFTGSL